MPWPDDYLDIVSVSGECEPRGNQAVFADWPCMLNAGVHTNAHIICVLIGYRCIHGAMAQVRLAERDVYIGIYSLLPTIIPPYLETFRINN